MRSLKNCEKLLEQGFTIDEIKNKLKTRSSRNKNYWIERGYEEKDAILLSKSRMPGTFEYYYYYKEIKDEHLAKKLSEKYTKENSRTEKNYIKKFGKKEGVKRWKSYCEKQARVNTFEHKQKKYGWTREQFDEYNKSRSVTLDNLINRHGEKIGKEKWNSYCKKQSYTNSLEYYQKKFGEENGKIKWEEVNRKKAHTIETYIEKYDGDIELATEKLIEFFKNLKSSSISSKISVELFSELTDKLIKMGYKKIFHYSFNNEWVINVRGHQTIFLDFYLRDTGKVIEFYGDYWHCNPKKYNCDQQVNIGGSLKKVKDVWKDDEKRINNILKLPYIHDIKIVWECDFRKNRDKVIQECIDFLIG